MHFLYKNQSYTAEQLCSVDHDANWFLEIQAFLREWDSADKTIEVVTSGSTGKPKSILLLKRNIEKSAELTIKYFGLQSKMQALHCLPSKFIAGKLMIIRAIQADMDLVLVEPSSNPLQKINQKIDFVAMTPFQMSHILKENPEKLKYVSKILLGGGILPDEINSMIRNVTPQCFLGFGMTETITHMAIQPLNSKSKSSTFKTLEGFSISQDERSCLVIEADHIYQKKVITNDVVEIIDSKNFRWIGRWDNVINTGGIKIFPEEVESKITERIKDPFFLYSFPDNELGEKVALFIESPQYSTTRQKKLKSDLNQILKKYEMPRSIIFLDCFNYTSTGKIRRKHTFRQYLEHV